MNTDELNYALPESLIAQHPCAKRDESRLLVLDRAAESIREETFNCLPEHFDTGDCIVLNDTRVIPARLLGRKETGGNVEIFLLKPLEEGAWEALVRPSGRIRPGARIEIGDGFSAWVEEPLSDGKRRVRFDVPDVIAALEASGEIPLPPYIRRTSREESDRERYQTIYARHPGAVAAPTAGLHFTEEIFEVLNAKGIARATITLHVGYGTFKPIQVERLEDHRVDSEEFFVSDETAGLLNRTRETGGRVVAVGTTTTRVLETQCVDGIFQAGSGATEVYIYPPYTFQGVDAMLTNFHLPRSSLLALVCAFGGQDFVLEAYRYAVEKKFRFYSYGDAMLIL